MNQRPFFLVCSCGQGEAAIAGVPEQQPVGHRRRGHSRAGGDGDCRHPLLETLPHGQVGLSARHRGQHSAAAEGKGQTHPPLHRHLASRAGEAQALDSERRSRGLLGKSCGCNGGVHVPSCY